MHLPDSPAIPAYLDLLKVCLAGMLHEETYRPLNPGRILLSPLHRRTRPPRLARVWLREPGVRNTNRPKSD